MRLYATAIATLLFTLISPSISAATAPDTIISNTAMVDFKINAVDAQTQPSNTVDFTVLDMANLNQGSVTVSGADLTNLFPGNSMSLDIDVTNDGVNALNDGTLKINTPASVKLTLTGTGATLDSESTANGVTTNIYRIADIPATGSEPYVANLSMPIDAQVNHNELTIDYRANRTDITSASTTLNLAMRTLGELELMQYSSNDDTALLTVNPTEYRGDDGIFRPITSPTIEKTGMSATAAPIPVRSSTKFSHNQFVIVKLCDIDHNIDRTVKETIEVDFNISDNGEKEHLRLIETDVNSGVFTGYITLDIEASPSGNNGVLSVHEDTEVNINYTDEVDNTDTNTSIILVDPFGLIFDSATGAPMNGYTVEMINMETGDYAEVYGDDGISAYPSKLVSGGSVTDSSGKVYNFSAGSYRFPFAPVGNYRLVVTPPEGAEYVWPSTQSLELINQLPNAPFAMTLGSRGETFPLVAGPPLHIDIPVDHLKTQMYVRRSADNASVAPGDFIHYTVIVENVDTVAVNNVVLTDILPHGFRLETGSVRIDDASATASSVSPDGTELTFNLSNMNAEDTHTIEYVAAVGAAQRGEARSTSYAIANSGAAVSNIAKVDTQVAEDLMRSRAILMGQVIIDVDEEDNDENGLSGVRIYMEDGRYAITDKRGMYHFDNIKPGSHVVQLDLDTLPAKYEVLLKEYNTRFAGRAWSQFVDVQGGTMWRTDFHVALKPKPQGNISLQLSNSPLRDNGEMEYSVALHNETVAIDNVRLTVMIPTGTEYKAGSSKLGDKVLEDPSIMRNMLTFRLGAIEGDWDETLSFTVDGIAQSDSPELVSKAFVLFNTPEKRNQRTPVASQSIMIKTKESSQEINEEFVLDVTFSRGDDQISGQDKQKIIAFSEKLKSLNNVRIHAVGHSDDSPVTRPETKKRFGDNYKLSAHRAMVIANELRDILELTPSQVTIEGRGPDEPIADNTTSAGRKANRRVHLYIYSDKITVEKDLSSIEANSSEKLEVSTTGKRPGEEEAAAPKKAGETTEQITSMPDFNKQWLSKQASGTEWIYPKQNKLPEIASTGIAIKHLAEQKITLLKNGEQVPMVNFLGTIKDNAGKAVSTWKGVDLGDGDNNFEAIIKGEHGNEVNRISHKAHFSTDPIAAEIIEEKSSLIADGITKPVIAIRLLDKDGYPARNGVSGQFRIAPPYKAVRDHNFNTKAMPGASAGIAEYTIKEAGIALITLEPTTESGEVKISLPFATDKTAELSAKLKAKGGEWIMVGIAEGTVGYNALSDNTEALSGNAAEEDLYNDGRIAFFARGKVLGKWLMTVAYDSDKARPNDADPELFQAIDPDTYYTIYGDTGHNGFAATSSEKLYLKLERDEFYFLFGDYETGLNDTQLAKYSRTLTGIKTRYQDERYDIIVFTSETNQAFVKDEFRGNGLTGPYELSRDNIAMNSEKIVIEVRNRFHNEQIISTEELARHTDYQIDYRTGIIHFREPLFSTDRDMNPQFIVAKYEAFDSNDERITYGGRAKVAVNDDLTVGVTHVNEGRTGGEAKLGGVDVTYQVSEKTKLYVEAARSIDSKETDINANGNSYLAEIEHQTAKSSNKLYFRDQESGFGLGQTNGSEDGMRKAGIETTVKATDKVTVKGEAYRQENTATKATRDVIEAQAQGNVGETGVRVGVRSAHDERGNGDKENSQQITAGASRSFIEDKVTAHIDREQNLSSGNSSDFPNRTRLGLDYRITDKTTLFVEQELADGNARETRNTLMGVKSTPWDGGEIYTGLSHSSDAQGNTTSANVSARQTWQLTDKWSMDVGAEETKTLSVSSTTPLNNNVPFASGNTNDFTAASVGLTYMPGDWMWTGRLETRNGSSEDRWQLATSLQTNPNTDLSTLTTLGYAHSEQSTGITTKATDIRLGLAYRPQTKSGHGRWIILNKLDLQWSDVSGSAEAGDNWRAINNLNANYKVDRWQLSLQYAAKTVSEKIYSLEYQSFTDLIGFEGRHDLKHDWDIGFHGSILRAGELNHYDYNSGISVGHVVAQNTWFSLGYNFTGFHDEDFSRSEYTSKGWFMKFRVKFDQESVKEAAEWLKK